MRAQDGNTPLWLAGLHDNMDTLSTLVKAGCDKDAKDKVGGNLRLYVHVGAWVTFCVLTRLGSRARFKFRSTRFPITASLIPDPLPSTSPLSRRTVKHCCIGESNANTPCFAASNMTWSSTAAHVAVLYLGCPGRIFPALTCHLASLRRHVNLLCSLRLRSPTKCYYDLYASVSHQQKRCVLSCRAAWNGKLPLMQALLAAGASRDAANSDGNSPLWVAALAGQLEAVRALAAAKADKDSRDKVGSVGREEAGPRADRHSRDRVGGGVWTGRAAGLCGSGGQGRQGQQRQGGVPGTEREWVRYVCGCAGHWGLLNRGLVAGGVKEDRNAGWAVATSVRAQFVNCK